MTQILPSQPGVPDDSAKPIQDVQQLAAYHAQGEKKGSGRLKVGMEHEKFGVFAATTRPIPFEGEVGVERILNAMAEKHGYTRIFENGRTIALLRGKAAISLEPGGQLELSGAPLELMSDSEAELDSHLAEVRAIAEPLGVVFYGMGYRPYVMPADVPRMPKARYRRMATYLQQAGSRGLEMMLSTATVQANLDYVSEADMGEKFRVAMGVAGLTTALFAASPYESGKPAGMVSRRMLTWTDTDNTRAGLLKFVLAGDSRYADYVQWALDVPLIFVRHGDEYAAPPPGWTLRRWMADGGRTLRAPVMADYVDQLSTLFPDVRLKQYLEVRTADTGDRAQLLALPALFKGILYSAAARKRAWNVVKALSFEQHLEVKTAAFKDGLRARVGPLDLGEACVELCLAAQEGLVDQGLADEARFVSPMLERARTRTSVADMMVARGGSPIEAALALTRLC